MLFTAGKKLHYITHPLFSGLESTKIEGWLYRFLSSVTLVSLYLFRTKQFHETFQGYVFESLAWCRYTCVSDRNVPLQRSHL
jgi:hypothetical protein